MAKRAKKSPDPIPPDQGSGDGAADPGRQSDSEKIFEDFEAAALRLIEDIGRQLSEAEFDWDDVESDPSIDDEAGLKESNKKINAIIRTFEAVKKFQNQRLKIIKESKNSLRYGQRDW